MGYNGGSESRASKPETFYGFIKNINYKIVKFKKYQEIFSVNLFKNKEN